MCTIFICSSIFGLTPDIPDHGRKSAPTDQHFCRVGLVRFPQGERHQIRLHSSDAHPKGRHSRHFGPARPHGLQPDGFGQNGCLSLADHPRSVDDPAGPHHWQATGGDRVADPRVDHSGGVLIKMEILFWLKIINIFFRFTTKLVNSP